MLIDCINPIMTVISSLFRSQRSLWLFLYIKRNSKKKKTEITEYYRIKTIFDQSSRKTIQSRQYHPDTHIESILERASHWRCQGQANNEIEPNVRLELSANR